MNGKIRAFVDWVGSHEQYVLLAMACIVGGTWIFIALADKVQDGDTHAIDRAVLTAMRRPLDPNRPVGPDNPSVPLGPRWVQESARDITALGGYPVLTLLTLAVVGFLALDRKFGAMWFVLGATVGGSVLTLGLKTLIDRPRPDVVEHLTYVATSSFPSGHSTMSAVVFLTLGSLLTRLLPHRWLRFYVLAVAILLTLLVGFTRIYLGVHYPSDVLAGWTAGLVWATLCWLVARAMQRRGRIESQV